MLTNLLKLMPSPKRRSSILWSASVGVGGLLYLKVWLPLTNLGIPCVFHEITGLYCPGCGITRAASSLLQLELNQAFRYNPLLFCLLPLSIVYVAARQLRGPRLAKFIMIAMVGVTLLFGVLRNLPMMSWLAPTLIE